MHQEKSLPLRHLILLLLLQFVFSFSLKAQDVKIISNFQHPTFSAKDSTAIIELIGASEHHVYKDLHQALHLVDSALTLSRNANFIYGIGNAYIAYAAFAMHVGNYPACDSFLKLAAPFCYLSSKESATNNLLVLWFQDKGNLEIYKGNYDQAVSYLFLALHTLEKKPNDSVFVKLKITLYNDIGSMLQYLNRPDKAIYYLSIGEQLAKSKKQFPTLASLYVNFGNAYRQKDDWTRSWAYLHQAVSLANKYQNLFVLQVAYLSLSNGFITKDEPDSAIFWLKKAMALSGNLNPYMSKAMSGITLGNIYLDKNEVKQAAFYGEKALAQGLALRAPQTVCLAHEILSKAYSAMGQWKRAFEHQKQFQILHDSLYNVAKEEAMNQLEVKYRVAQKDKLLTQQNFALSQQHSALREKNFWIIGIALVCILLLLLLGLIRKNHASRQKVLKGEMALARMKAVVEGGEQERLRISRELHDGIVSRLLAIKLNLSASLQKDNSTSIQNKELRNSLIMLTEAMKDLRDTSHNLSNESFSRLGFQDSVSSFCEEVSGSGTLEVVFQAYGLPKHLKDPILLPIFRMIQELIQNVLKHAQAHTLLVQLNYQNDILGITVQDDGVGLKAANFEESSGSGMTNLKQRVKSLNGIVEISSDETGTSIYLEFSNLFNQN